LNLVEGEQRALITITRRWRLRFRLRQYEYIYNRRCRDETSIYRLVVSAKLDVVVCNCLVFFLALNVMGDSQSRKSRLEPSGAMSHVFGAFVVGDFIQASTSATPYASFKVRAYWIQLTLTHLDGTSTPHKP
jgi:hypothetical protein